MKKKIVTLCLAAALAVTAIGGTLAYFTDVTEEKQNVFTVGGVDIDLDEPAWDEEAKHNILPGVDFAKDPTITVAENSDDCYVFLEMDLNKYVSLVNLMGVDAYKNNIGGLKGDYPGFGLFLNQLVNNTDLRQAVVDRWFTGIEHSNWEIMNLAELKELATKVAAGQNPTNISIIFGYKEVLSATDEVTFMTAFGMPETVTQSMMDGEDAYKINDVSKSNFNTDSAEFRMTFTAYAVQKAEIATLADAYKNMPTK